MAYTRIYPISAGSYSPSDNPILEGIGELTIGADTIGGVNPAIITAISAAPTDFDVTIFLAPDSSDVHTYTVNSVSGTAIRLDLNDGAGTSFAATESGKCRYRAFNNTVPSSYDNAPEAVLFEVAPTATFKVKTAAGEYIELNPGLFTAFAIYNISILEILDAGGGEGVLLGSSGYNGSPLIP